MLTSCDFELPFNQINAGDQFSDRVFNLKAGIHLHEVELTSAIEQELNRTSAYIVNRLSGLNCGFTHLFTQFITKTGSWCFFDYFLVTTLNGTVTIRKIDTVAMLVSKYLDFHMARLQYAFFDQKLLIAKT